MSCLFGPVQAVQPIKIYTVLEILNTSVWEGSGRVLDRNGGIAGSSLTGGNAFCP